MDALTYVHPSIDQHGKLDDHAVFILHVYVAMHEKSPYILCTLPFLNQKCLSHVYDVHTLHTLLCCHTHGSDAAKNGKIHLIMGNVSLSLTVICMYSAISVDLQRFFPLI